MPIRQAPLTGLERHRSTVKYFNLAVTLILLYWLMPLLAKIKSQ